MQLKHMEVHGLHTVEAWVAVFEHYLLAREKSATVQYIPFFGIVLLWN